MCNKLVKVMKKVISFIIKITGIKYICLFIRENSRTCFDNDKYIAQCNIVMETHKETFGKYKGVNSGKEIVLIATGPSLNQYKPIENAINIGVNKSILYDKIKLNYFFSQDYENTQSYLNNVKKYPDLISFFGQLQRTSYGNKSWILEPYIIPESIIHNCNAHKYFVYVKTPYYPMFLNPDINLTWLGDGGSVIFSAMQFALFTHPKKIYLVGCDCSSGHYDKKNNKSDCNKFVKHWKTIKQFRDIYYPDIEIISVNPVGLKGLFKDLVQE